MAKIQHRRDTAANWATANPVLADGEIGIDRTNRIRKTGDGVRTWAQLSAEYIGDPAWSVADTFNRANATSIAGADWMAATYYNPSAAVGITSARATTSGYNPNGNGWADASIHRSNSRSLAQKAQIDIDAFAGGTTAASFQDAPPAAIVLRAPMFKLPSLAQTVTINGAGYTDSIIGQAVFLGIKGSNWYVYVHAIGRGSVVRTTDICDAGYCVARGAGSFTGGGTLAAQIDSQNIASLTYKGTVLWSDEIPSAPNGTYLGFNPGGAATTMRNFAASTL